MLLDLLTPYPAVRWLTTVLLGLAYMGRIVYVQVREDLLGFLVGIGQVGRRKITASSLSF